MEAPDGESTFLNLPENRALIGPEVAGQIYVNPPNRRLDLLKQPTAAFFDAVRGRQNVVSISEWIQRLTHHPDDSSSNLTQRLHCAEALQFQAH
jgi:hypothetical protein